MNTYNDVLVKTFSQTIRSAGDEEGVEVVTLELFKTPIGSGG